MDSDLEGPHLPAVGMVSQLSDEDREILSSYGEFHIAEAGKHLIMQGISHGRLHYILSGVLHAIRHEAGRDMLLGTIRKGEWVGEVDLFDPGHAMCSVVVIERVQYWTIARPDLDEFLKNYHEAGIQVVLGAAAMLSKRLRSVTNKLMDEADLAAARASLLVEA